MTDDNNILKLETPWRGTVEQMRDRLPWNKIVNIIVSYEIDGEVYTTWSKMSNEILSFMAHSVNYNVTSRIFEE